MKKSILSSEKTILYFFILYSLLGFIFVFSLDFLNQMIISSLFCFAFIFFYSIYFMFAKKIKLTSTKIYNLRQFLKISLFIIFASTSCFERINILFFDVEKYLKDSTIKTVQIEGYFKTGTSLRGGESWAYASSLKNKNEKFIMVCDLIDRADCKYGDMKGGKLFLKSIEVNLYPLKRYNVVYELRELNGDVIVSDINQLKIYRKNKINILIYFFMVLIPSIFFCFIFLKKLNRPLS